MTPRSNGKSDGTGSTSASSGNNSEQVSEATVVDDPAISERSGAHRSRGAESRRLAIEAVRRIEVNGSYANIMLPAMLDKADLSPEDNRFVSYLVYGTTRMQRSCDFLVNRFVVGEPDDQVRAALRVGAYQLAFLKTPPHAAVSATVEAVSGRGRSMVNAVLRRVAEAPVEYPNEQTELSYPDWIYNLLVDELGYESAISAMKAMNEPALVRVRDDGYVQDLASQAVVAATEVAPDDVVIDICAAPGGKATGLAKSGATVLAGDRKRSRANLIARNVDRLGSHVALYVADGRHLPFRPNVADCVLVDAPCSGLGSLRRRADARWRVQAEDVKRLGDLQAELINAGLSVLKPGGRLVYSVCTFGQAEGEAVIAKIVDSGRATVDHLPEGKWIKRNNTAILIPGESDGMMISCLRRSD